MSAIIRRRSGLGVWALLLVCGVAAHGQENVVSLTLQGAEDANPATSVADVEAGARIFRRSCALCHGGDATGGLGPDLTRGAFRHGSSDVVLFRNILTGIRGTDMPGVYRPDTEIWQVVSYVRSLSVGAQDVVVAGNARSGSILYRSKGECSGCHRVGGRGGLLGPDLSDVGWIRSPEHIETSLLRPGDVVDDSYRKVAVELKSGGEVVGLLRNESTYSIQMLDETGKLRSFEKSDLASLDKPSDSLMPAFDDLFSPGEIQDLVAYLYSLKGEQ